MTTFAPFVADHGIRDLLFFFGTEEAERWYHPPKPYALLEYAWVLENIPLDGKRVIDGGAHHGHYSIVLASAGASVVAVDPIPSNLDAVRINKRLNGFENTIVEKEAALWHESGTIGFTEGVTNGGVLPAGEGRQVTAVRLADLGHADVVKLDIEGAEYVVLPTMTDWPDAMIVECHLSEYREHAWPTNPNVLAKLFLDHGYRLDWVNRERMVVEPYNIGTTWQTHGTLFARRA